LVIKLMVIIMIRIPAISSHLLHLYLDAKEGLKDAASGAKESVQEAGSKLGDKAHGNYYINLPVIKLGPKDIFYFTDVKESIKGKASGAVKSVQEAGSKLGDKAHGLSIKR